MFAASRLLNRRVLSLALCVVPGLAVAAPAKAKKPPVSISIENGRKVALNTFEITHVAKPVKRGAKPSPGKAVLKLEEPLLPGEKKDVKLSGAKGCAYVARWSFADASDEGQIDLCGEPKIVLTD